MSEALNFWELAVNSANRAVHLEMVANIRYVLLKKTGEKDYALSFGFYHKPNEEDLEALSLIETEIVSDIWNWVGELKYDWSVSHEFPSLKDDDEIAIIYQNEELRQ